MSLLIVVDGKSQILKGVTNVYVTIKTFCTFKIEIIGKYVILPFTVIELTVLYFCAAQTMVARDRLQQSREWGARRYCIVSHFCNLNTMRRRSSIQFSLFSTDINNYCSCDEIPVANSEITLASPRQLILYWYADTNAN